MLSHVPILLCCVYLRSSGLCLRPPQLERASHVPPEESGDGTPSCVGRRHPVKERQSPLDPVNRHQSSTRGEKLARLGCCYELSARGLQRLGNFVRLGRRY